MARGLSPVEIAALGDPARLAGGTARQRAAARALAEIDLFAVLAPDEARVVGSLPLGIEREESDLDVACCAPDPEVCGARLDAAYGDRPDYRRTPVRRRQGAPATVARMTAGGVRVEIFVQSRPVTAQRAWRHMIVEARLLALGGAALRARLDALRRAPRTKVEPAFARLLGLAGEPYAALLDLENWSDARLARHLAARGLGPRE